jgi:hypothetical protein
MKRVGSNLDVSVLRSPAQISSTSLEVSEE